MTTLALIGAGRWGKNYLNTADTLKDKDIEIKYVCAQNQQTLNLLPDTYIKTLSIEDLLENKKIDGFIIATPATTHFAIAKHILSLGHNLLIEKPLTVNYNQALTLQKIWQNKKSKVLIGHTYLYDPAYQVFKKIFEGIETYKSIVFEGLSSPVRKDVSVIWDWGPHPISLLLDLIKYPVVEVRAIGSINHPGKLFDRIKALIHFANGIEASIHISWFGSRKVRRLTIEGEKKKIELDYTNTTNRKIIFHKSNKLLQYPKYESISPLTKELLEFVKAIKGLRKITSDMNIGVSVVKVLTAIEKSAINKGLPVKLNY